MPSLQRFATGSDQRPTRPLSTDFAVIANANALTADSAGLVNASIPTESPNVAGVITASGAKYVVKREPTVSIALRFSLGHSSDASGKTASIKIRSHRRRELGPARGRQFRGSFELDATLTAGTIEDTNSMLIRNPAPSQATSLKHVSTITILRDLTLTPPGARVISNGVGGIATLVIDDASCEYLEIECSVNGGTAECLTGEYTEF